jgi:hypothetical protein
VQLAEYPHRIRDVLDKIKCEDEIKLRGVLKLFDPLAEERMTVGCRQGLGSRVNVYDGGLMNPLVRGADKFELRSYATSHVKDGKSPVGKSS